MNVDMYNSSQNERIPGWPSCTCDHTARSDLYSSCMPTYIMAVDATGTGTDMLMNLHMPHQNFIGVPQMTVTWGLSDCQIGAHNPASAFASKVGLPSVISPVGIAKMDTGICMFCHNFLTTSSLTSRLLQLKTYTKGFLLPKSRPP
jgi:hypothetical protein